VAAFEKSGAKTSAIPGLWQRNPHGSQMPPSVPQAQALTEPVDAAEPVDAVLAVELLDVADEVVVEEITSPLAFVTVVVTVPPGPCVTVVVSPDEDDEAEDADSDIAAAPEAPEVPDFAIVAEPVAPGVAVGEPSAAMALLRLALILMVCSPNPSGFATTSR
jgi:hypothetical protein